VYKTTVPVILFGLFIVLPSCTTTNWPQFRGSDQNMVVKAGTLPAEWGEELNIRWKSAIEKEGWSSPVVWGDRVFITSAVPVKVSPPVERQRGEPAPEGEDQSYLRDVYRWQVTCFDLKTGEAIWNRVAREGNPRIKKHRGTTYAGETPVTDGKRLYVYFGMTGVYCYDLEGGLLWEKDLGAFPTLNGWGTGSSPVLYRGRLYVQVDNEEQSFLVALDSATGQETWRVDRDEKTSYSTPFIWKHSTGTELVTGGKTARSYDPETGKLLWELRMAGHYTIPSPVAEGDHLFLGNTAFRDTPGTLFCVRAGAEGDITPAEGETTSSGVVWSNPDAPTDNPSMLLLDGLLYQVSSRGGTVTCMEAATGEVVYQERIGGVGRCWASPWAWDGKVHFTDEKGVTRVFRAGRAFELLGENRLDDTFWTSVAAAGDAYLMRGAEFLYCIGQ